jgi:hypothetical protein
MIIPKTPKGISNRITKIRSQLSAFKREYGGHDDSGGARYYLFYLYFILGDNRRSSEYLRWFEKEFPDDSGEPFALLCWAYLIPHLLGESIDKIEMFNSSNWAQPGFMEYFPERVHEAINEEDLSWIREKYESDYFKKVLKRHIEIETELEKTPRGDKRSSLVRELYSLLEKKEL